MWFQIPNCPRCHEPAANLLGQALTTMPLVSEEADGVRTFDWGECSVVSWDSEVIVRENSEVQLTCPGGHDWSSVELDDPSGEPSAHPSQQGDLR